MTTRLMLDRRWIINGHGPTAPLGRYGFRTAPPPKPTAPVLASDKPWESMSSGWGTLLIEDGRWRFWYEAWDEHYRDDFDSRLCYAESVDGVTWVKPELGLVDYNGSTANNIIMDGHGAGHLGLHGSSIFVDPSSPPEARYRCIFMGCARRWDEAGWAANPMSFAFSADGIRWHWGVPDQGSWLNPPLTAFSSDTQAVVRWDEGLRRYVGYFRTLEHGFGRTIGRAETSNFSRWPHPETIVAPDEQDLFGVDLYNNAASVYRVPGDEAHFFFISMFDHASDTLNIQLATSRDGWHYKRLAREPFVASGATFDRGGAYMCPGIHRVGDDLVMMYNAVPFKHGEATPDKIRYSGSYVVMRFPHDRFQGLHADSPFEFNVPLERGVDGRLNVTLNACVAPGGRILAGVRLVKDERDYLTGFTPADSATLTGDGVRLPLSWQGGDAPAVPAGASLELRLILEQATLFSYTC